MAQQARDEAGNIWEVDAQGNAVRLIQAAGAQAAPPPAASASIVAPSPWRVQQQQAQDADRAADNVRADRSADRQDANAARVAANDAARLDLDRQRLQMTQAGQAGGKLTSKERSDAIGGYKSGQAVERLVADLEKLYAQGPGATSGLEGLQDYLPLTANQRFDQAGNAARGNVGTALGFTGGQLNTATEAAQSVGPYLPQAGDRDDVILDKIQRLRTLAKDARERSVQILGGVPDANGRVTPVGDQSAPAATPEAPPPPAATVAPVQAAQRGAGGGDFTSQAGIAMAKKLAAAYRGGAGIDQLNKMLTGNGFEPFTDPTAIQQINKRQPLQFAPPRVDDDRSALSKAAGAAAGGAAGAYGLGATNALTGGYLDEMLGGQTQIAKEFAAREHPLATLAGGITGAAAASLPIGKGIQALGAASPVAAALIGTGARGAATGDALYGAVLGSGEANENRVTGALAGGVGSLAGNALVRGTGAVVKGVSDPAVRHLTERGIPLSVGQTLGNRGMIGRTVNKLESLPVVGDLIGARRGEGIKAFNTAAINDALEPIGSTIKGEAGQAAVGQAQDAVSDAYRKALSGVRVQADPQFMAELSGAVTRGRAVPVQGEQFGHLMDTRFAPLFGPGVTLDGDTAQAALQAVRGARSQFGQEGAMGGLVSDELGNIDSSIASLLTRQAPQAADGLTRANAAYAALQPVNAASMTAVNGGMGAGVFTPAQLNRAVASNTKAYGGKAAAARGAKQTDLMTYAQEVLPSTVPDSGTGGRIAAMLLPAALGGGAYGMSDISPESATVLGVLAAASTKTGSKAVQNALVRRPEAARKIGAILAEQARIGGVVAPAALLPYQR